MKYRYIGRKDLEYDNAHDEYYLNIVAGDVINITEYGNGYQLVHENDSKIKFFLTKREGKALLKECEQTVAIIPDADNPPYLVFLPKIESVKPLYDYYNGQLFNNKCPVVKIKKTHQRSTLGLAQVQWVGRKPVFTLFISEAAMVDRILFTNTLVHEMIHMYQYALGHEKLDSDSKKAMEHIHHSHGPLFQKEMHRINGHGFNISVVAESSYYEGDSSEKFYGLVAYNTNQAGAGVAFWSNYNPLHLMQDFCNKLSVKFPNKGWRVEALETNDKRLVMFQKLGKVTQVQAAKVKEENIYKFNGRVLQSEDVHPSSAVSIPTYKDMPNEYAMPLQEFVNRMSKYKAPKQILEQRWKQTPLRNVNKRAEQLISVLVGRVSRKAITGPEVLNYIEDIRMMYDGRFTMRQFQDALHTFVKRYDPKGNLTDHIGHLL